MKKIWIYTFLTVLIAGLTVISFLFNNDEIQAESNGIFEDSLITVTISFIGDLMCHSTQYNYARVENDSFDFRPVYKEVKDYLLSSDLMVGNLETVTAGKKAGYSGYPFFNTPDDYIAALYHSGFDLLTTANNHSLDQGEKGVQRTIEQLMLNNLNYVGTFSSQRDRDSIRVFDLNGITVAVLSYTYGTNGIPKPKGKDYVVNLIEHDLINRDISNARKTGCDIVIVSYHFGEEYKRFPNQYQIEVVNQTIKSGADIIIGSHPHVIQPVDFYKTQNAKLDSGFIAYSLGNFISNQRWRYSDAGVILNIELTKNLSTDSIFISGVNYLPTCVFRGNTDLGKEFIILPSQRYDDTTYYFLSKEERKLMKQALDDTGSILTEYTDRIKLNELR